MESDQSSLDLASEQNEILLNPRFPQKDLLSLRALAEQAQRARQLHGHVWIATSGSTADSIGSTKLVALSKNALKASAVAVNEHLQVTSQDVWTQVLPHFHVGGLGIEVRAQLARCKVVNALRDQKWDVRFFYDVLTKENCSLSALVPTQVYDLVAAGLRSPPSLRAIVVGGGVFDASLYSRARELGWPVLPSYGMTETASQIATASLSSLQSKDYPAIELLSHAEARVTSQGFLQVQASSLFTCYAQNTLEGARHWDPKQMGWFTTEDRGEVQERCVLIEGRGKDYIKIGGEGVNLAQLRRVLEQVTLELNPQWPQQVCLIDMPSERLGAEIHLVTSLSSPEIESILEKYLEKVLPFEKIRKVHYVQEIPRTDLGKIQWSLLRKSLC